MSPSVNLAQYFQQQQQQQQQQQRGSQSAPVESAAANPTHSKAIDAQDDDHFENTTFQLKRTRSVGLLDEFIIPTRKLIEQDQQSNDEEEDEFIEDVNNSETKETSKPSLKVYTSYDDDSDLDSEEEEEQARQHEQEDTITTPTSSSTYIHSPTTSSSPPLPHDDNDIVYEPSSHVDYLSHDWKESDISKSWRYIVLKRKDVANSARLENASWRTWAQAKYNLKTIHPEEVNWSKDSDVTWLYGPLYREPSSTSLNDENSSSGKVKYGSDNESSSVNMKSKLQINKKKAPSTNDEKKQKIKKGPKPILKKRTVSEMLSQKFPTEYRNPTSKMGNSPVIEAYNDPAGCLPTPPKFEEDFDEISRKVNAQYLRRSKNSNSNLSNLKSQNLQQLQQQLQSNPAHPPPLSLDNSTNRASPLVSPQLNSVSSSNLSSPQLPPSIPNQRTLISVLSKNSSMISSQHSTNTDSNAPAKRHIHFNDRVDQCIALDVPNSENEEDDNYEGDDDNEYSHGGSNNDDDEDSDEEEDGYDDDDEEGGFFLMVKSPSAPQIHNNLNDDEEDEEQGNNETNDDGDTPTTTNTTTSSKRYQTIELLPSTTLKCCSDDEDGATNYALSHNVNTSRGFNYYYDYNSVYTDNSAGFNSNPNSNNSFQYDQEPTSETLEGVNLVDIPENIVLGSNVSEYQAGSQPQAQAQPLSARQHSNDTFSLGSSSNSGSEESLINIPRKTSKDNFSLNLSSSPSCTSLSDVAAQGFISHNSNGGSLSNMISNLNHSPAANDSTASNDTSASTSASTGTGNHNDNEISELNKEFNNLNPNNDGGEDQSANTTTSSNSIKSSILNSWKRS